MEKSLKLEVELKAVEIRKETIKEIASLGVGHIGGSLSIADLLAVLYFSGVMNTDPNNPKKEDRDYLVCSKGHAGPAVYATLALKGFFPLEMLSTLNKGGTSLPSHCDMNKTPGIDMTTGSLGQGASTACGIALGNKIKGLDNFTYLILGDGEIEEGQVWEAAMFASIQKLGHLIAFVDYNKLQIDGKTNDLAPLGDIAKKFEEFGWKAQTINGHSIDQIYKAIVDAKREADNGLGAPHMIVLDTIKGHGCSFTEGQIGSHSRNVTQEDAQKALSELEDEERQIKTGANK